jgi:hypothetical protein
MSRILNGTTSYGEAADSATLKSPTDQITVLQWVRIDDVVEQPDRWRLINKGSYTIEHWWGENVGRLFGIVRIDGSGLQTSVFAGNSLPTETWVACFLTWEAGEPVRFRGILADGTVVRNVTSDTTSDVADVIDHNTDPYRIGGNGALSGLAKVGPGAVWPVKLTDQQVTDLATGANPMTVGSPVGCWDVRSEGSTDPDLTGNGNTITWSNAAFDADDPPVDPAPGEVDPAALTVARVDGQGDPDPEGAAAKLEWPTPAMSGATHVDIFRGAAGGGNPPFDPETDAPLHRVTAATTEWTDTSAPDAGARYQVFPVVVE